MGKKLDAIRAKAALAPYHLDMDILDTATGERKQTEDSSPWDDLDLAEFMYQDGNYACDCNRGLIFFKHEPEGCGDHRYVMKATVRETGVVLFDEFEDFDEFTEPQTAVSP